MNKTKIVKLATSAFVGAGASHVVDGIVQNNVNFDNLNRFCVFQVAAARVVLGFVVAAKTKEYTDARIDEVVDAWNEIRSDEETTTEA